jgi:hypothetical protein
VGYTTGANAGYGNFTLTGNVPYGSNTILFSAGFSGSHTEYWKIWIDYNKMVF